MGHIIRKLRKQARLSQKDVAEALGVGQSAVSHWENGTVLPSLDKIPKLARVLNVTEQTLIDELDGTDADGDTLAQTSPALLSAQEVAEPTPESPYLKSLEMAVMRAQSLDDLPVRDTEPATVPLITPGKVHSGKFTYEELMGRSVEVPASVLRDHPAAEALVVEGNCMNRVAGDSTIVVFDPNLPPTNGRIVIVETDSNEVLVRRWHKGSDKLLLTADSYEHYADIVIENDRPIRVVGTVVHIVTPEAML